MTSNVNAVLGELKPVIKRAAKSVEFQWPGVVEADDVDQGIMLRLWESPDSIVKIFNMEPKPKYRAIVGIGHQLAAAERTDYDQFKGSYNYAVADVKALLAQDILIEDEPLHYSAERVDFEDAMEALDKRAPQYFKAIHARYGAEGAPPGDKSGQNALERGLTALAEEMNKVSRRRYARRDDGIGTREVLTSSAAQYLSKHQYDGEDPDWEEANRVEDGRGGSWRWD